jgi:hypothetical protein
MIPLPQITARAPGCDGGAGALSSDPGVSSQTSARPFNGPRPLWAGTLTHCAWYFHNIKRWCPHPVMAGRDFCGIHPL